MPPPCSLALLTSSVVEKWEAGVQKAVRLEKTGQADAPELGISFPVDGIGCFLASGLYNGLRESIRSFTSKRPLRKACDLARPL